MSDEHIYEMCKLFFRWLKDCTYTVYHGSNDDPEGFTKGDICQLIREEEKDFSQSTIIRTNPSDKVMAELRKKTGNKKGIRHALTLEQQRAFMNYIAQSPVFVGWLPFFTVLLGTGCRIGEVVGLRWQDVDLEKRIININHAMSYYPRREDTYKCEFRVSLPKTEAGIRVLPMMQKVYEALKGEYDRQMEEGFSEAVVDGMTGFIFTNRFDTIHNPQAVNRADLRSPQR